MEGIDRARNDRREEIAVALFSVWCIAGLFLDGWSHRVDKPETFFTPWHALLYSGFGVATGWSFFEANRPGSATRSMPIGSDRLTRLGVGLFAAGMVGDFLWHTLFGVEQDVEALLSPTHLTLMTGGLLLTSAPLRIRLRIARDIARPTLGDLFPALVSAAATTALVAFFLQFGSTFTADATEFAATVGHDGAAEILLVVGILSVLVTSTLLSGVTALLVRAWHTPPGALTAVVGAVGVASAGLDAFHHVGLVVPAVLAGLAADSAVHRGRRDLAPVLVPVVLWPAWFIVMATTETLGWSANAIGGAIVLTTLAGVGVRLLAFGSVLAAGEGESHAEADHHEAAGAAHRLHAAG